MKKLLLVLAVVLFANVARAEGFGFCIGPKIGYQTTKLYFGKKLKSRKVFQSTSQLVFSEESLSTTSSFSLN